jgi:antitoxin VapB
MKQVNLKSDRVAALLEQITERTGETKIDAVTKALEERLQELETKNRASRTLTWLKATVWSNPPEGERGKMPSKEEQEELLGF